MVPIAAVAATVTGLAIIFPIQWLVVAAIVAGLTVAGGAAVLVAGWALSRRAVGESVPVVKGHDRFVIVTVAATAVLWALCAPDVYFRDGGELAGAAVGLGVPHPTGFPAFCMAGKLFSFIPAGTAFFRINLLSGLAAALAAAMSWLLADRVTRRSESIPAALWWVAPLAFLGSANAWLHATTTEVYSISMLGLAAVVFLGLESVQRRDARLLAAAASIAGIGAGVHITMPLYGSFVILACLVGLARCGACGPDRLRGLFRTGFLVMMAGVIGTFVVLYLPVAAGRDPLLNWGDPSSLDRFVAHLSGQRIRDSFGGRIGGSGIVEIVANATMAGRNLVESLWPILPLAISGVVLGGRRRPLAVVILLFLILADLAFAVFINPMGIFDLQVLMTATWATAVLAGIGASEIAFAMIGRAGTAGWLATGGLAALLVVFQWISAPADRDMSGLHGAREITDHVVRDYPWGSIVMTASDDLSSILLGRQAVEDSRPDLAILVKQHLSDQAFVTRRLNPFRLAFPAGGRASILDAVDARPFESAGETASDGLARAVRTFMPLAPVFLEPGEGRVDESVIDLFQPAFPLWVAAAPVASGPGGSPDGPFREVQIASLASMTHLHGLDRWGRAWLAEFNRLLGTRAAMAGRDGDALKLLQRAVTVNPDDFRAWHNLGVLADAGGDSGIAVKLVANSVSINPGYARGWQTLAAVAGRAGRHDLARDSLRRAAALLGTQPTRAAVSPAEK